MKLATLRRLVPVLLLLGAATLSMTGCVLVPVPVGGGGYHGGGYHGGGGHHGHGHGHRYRHSHRW